MTPPENWTVLTLKQHFDQRLLDQDKAVQAALAAAEKAVAAALAAAEKAREQAENNSEKWRQNANEWREAMNDREVKFAMKPEVEGEFRSIRMEISGLKQSRDVGVGRSAVLATVVSVVIGLLMLFASKYLGR
jgi:hypothetical protein